MPPKISVTKEIIAHIYRNRCVTIENIKRLYEELCKRYECPS